MSAVLVCPEFEKKLRVPDTVMGKAFRCPACKALIPPISAPEDDLEPEEEQAVRDKPRRKRLKRKSSSRA